MTQQRLRVLFISIFLSLPSPYDGLAIRAKRSLAQDPVTDQDVIQALNVLQRAGLTGVNADSALRDDDYNRPYPAELINRLVDSSMAMDDSLVLPPSESDDDYVDDEDNQNEMSPVIAGISAQESNQVPVGLNDDDEEEDDDDKEDDKRTMEKRPVDKEELQGLFQPTPEVIVEAAAALATENTKQETNADGKEKIVRSEIVKLLSDDSSGTSPTNQKVVEVDKVETEETQPGKDGVLRKTQTTEWIFKPDITEGIDFYPRPEGLAEGLANKEWLIDLAGGGSNPSSFGSGKISVMKKKRSSEPPSPAPTVGDVSDPVGLRREAVELLKAYIEQQEDENRHLAKALNLATLSQVEASDEYLEQEIEEIKKAAKNEKVLEALREVIALASQSGISSDTKLKELEPYLRVALMNTENDDEEDEEDFKDKRGSSEIKPDPELWTDSAPMVLTEGIPEEAENDDVIDDAIKNKLRELLIEASDGKDERRLVPAESIINEYNRYRLNPFLRDIYDVESGTPLGLVPLVDKYSDPDGVCEAVELLADDCRAARSHNLMLDSEATELCDRHKLCYKCGGYFGMTSDTCDRGYMNEAAVACSRQRDPDTCHEDALGLYAVMIGQHIALSPGGYPSAPPECAAPCVYGFIVGADRRRRR